MLRGKRLFSWIPTRFLWRLTFLNTVVIIIATAISGWAIYNTACFLAAGVGGLDPLRQQQFNRTLLNYLWIFIGMAVIAGSIIHYYFTKYLIKPIRELTQSTKQLKKGRYPELVSVNKQDEIGQLVSHYNDLITQLRQNDENRKKLVSDLSHEIRTPLSNLNGYLLALKDGDVKGNKTLFTSLYNESMRLSHLVEQMEQLKEWDHIRTQATFVKEEVNMADLLHEGARMFQWAVKQRNISITIEADPVRLYVYIEGMQQVISNLLHNAIAYYKGIGPIVLLGKVRDDVYEISVTGPSEPIPQEAKEQIFHRFYRQDPSRSRNTGGTGLGLAIVKEIIERHHHGEVGVKTTKDENTFWMTIPLRKR